MGCRMCDQFTAPVDIVLLDESANTRDGSFGHWAECKSVGDLCQRGLYADQPGNCRKTRFTRHPADGSNWQPVWLEGYPAPS